MMCDQNNICTVEKQDYIVHRAWALSIFTSVHNEADDTLDESEPSLFIVSQLQPQTSTTLTSRSTLLVITRVFSVNTLFGPLLR